jgi:predicted nucleic acid-binding protein
MPQYFVDTWFLVALFDARDSDHARALRVDRAVRGATLVTHDGILSEFLAFVSSEGERIRLRAARVVREVLRERVVVETDRSLFLAALTRYEQRPDKEYSLVDCMSMVVMEQRGIRHVLTNDHHFSQAGFVVVNQ